MTDTRQISARLMLGDCLLKMKSIKSGSIDMVLADPPYGTTKCGWDSIIPLDELWAAGHLVYRQYAQEETLLALN